MTDSEVLRLAAQIVRKSHRKPNSIDQRHITSELETMAARLEVEAVPA